jgi:hypothetical protein
MTTTSLPLYRILIKLGASETDAEAAAIADETNPVAKADLRAELSDLRSDLLKWGIGLLFTGLALQNRARDLCLGAAGAAVST